MKKRFFGVLCTLILAVALIAAIPLTVGATDTETPAQAALDHISFYTDTPAYDAATNTFTVFEAQPLILTIKGTNLMGKAIYVECYSSSDVPSITMFGANEDETVTYRIPIDKVKQYIADFEAAGHAADIVKIRVKFPESTDYHEIILNVVPASQQEVAQPFKPYDRENFVKNSVPFSFDCESDNYYPFSVSPFESDLAVAGEVYEENGEFFCDVTWDIQKTWDEEIAERLDHDGYGHTLGDEIPERATFTAKWNGEKWQYVEGFAVYTLNCLMPIPYYVSVMYDEDYGTVELSSRYAIEGETVTMTITPKEPYVSAAVTVTDKEKNEIELGENYSFVMPKGGASVQVVFLLSSDVHEKEGYEIIWSETFDTDTMPDSFTSVDYDGDGYSWAGEADINDLHVTLHSHGCQLGHSIGSPSFINQDALPLSSDNRLVFPTLALKEYNEYLLSFMVRAQDVNYPDHFYVAISLDGGESFVKEFEKRSAPTEWEEFVLDLSEYAGQNVTVVIFHQDYDMFYLVIDCVHLYEKRTPLGEVSEEVDGLTDAVEGLQSALEEKADTDVLNQAVAALLRAIEKAEGAAADADDALKVDLEGAIEEAKQAVSEAYQKALEDAVALLEEKIDAQIDPDELAKAVQDLTEIIDALDGTYATDETLAQALNTVTEAYQKAIEEAVKSLNAAIADKTDADALADAVAELEGAINGAKGDLEAAESELARINDELGSTKSALESTNSALESAKSELAEQDSDLHTFAVIVCVVSVAAFCGCVALAVLYILEKKKKH